MSLLTGIAGKRGAFVIAEIGVNYYDVATDLGIGVYEAAVRMIDEARLAGADAVKFQTYKAEKIVSKHSPAYWDRNEEPTATQRELFLKFDKFGEPEYRALADHCRTTGIMFCSTPFDFESADYLDPLMPLFKISSSDLTNLPFIRHLARKGKPILLSTGASTIGEIDIAVQTILGEGNEEICLLHCVLDYPTAPANANLQMIRHLGQVFPRFLLGYSDHVRPDPSMVTLTTAYLFGAKVIEKHFTLNKALKGNDHYHAMDAADLATFVGNVELIETVRGGYEKHPLPCEAAARLQARRSIVAARDIEAGELIDDQNMTFKRPGTGISPSLFEQLRGRPVRRRISEDMLLSWDDL
ncbi:MAG: N-acetylneuraminate synthase family protein [Gemmatimonadales bacterium]